MKRILFFSMKKNIKNEYAQSCSDAVGEEI